MHTLTARPYGATHKTPAWLSGDTRTGPIYSLATGCAALVRAMAYINDDSRSVVGHCGDAAAHVSNPRLGVLMFI